MSKGTYFHLVRNFSMIFSHGIKVFFNLKILRSNRWCYFTSKSLWTNNFYYWLIFTTVIVKPQFNLRYTNILIRKILFSHMRTLGVTHQSHWLIHADTKYQFKLHHSKVFTRYLSLPFFPLFFRPSSFLFFFVPLPLFFFVPFPPLFFVFTPYFFVPHFLFGARQRVG